MEEGEEEYRETPGGAKKEEFKEAEGGAKTEDSKDAVAAVVAPGTVSLEQMVQVFMYPGFLPCPHRHQSIGCCTEAVTGRLQLLPPLLLGHVLHSGPGQEGAAGRGLRL